MEKAATGVTERRIAALEEVSLLKATETQEDREETRSLPLFRLEGTGRQRGEAYGEQARHLVQASALRWAELASTQLTISLERYLALLIEGTGFENAARRVAPDLVDEVDGIAAASGVERRHVLALNLMDEDWWFRTQFGVELHPDQCSAFGVGPTNGQEAILGQNMDLRDLDGLGALLEIQPTRGPRVLAPTHAGMIATNAMNECGIGICVTTLSQLPTSTSGLPVAFVIRTLANSTTHEEAVVTLKRLRHASGETYFIGSPTGLDCFECSASSVVPYAPGARIAHTNHPLAAAEHRYKPDSAHANSAARLGHLKHRLTETPRVSSKTAGAFLAESPLCRGKDGDSGSTFYSVIMEPAAKRLWLTGGPPDRCAFREFAFEEGAMR
jgi:hypothetical protein